MADDLLSQIRLNGAVPRHVAMIMDGNGRWARERSLPRPLGHREGMKAVREVVEGAIAAGVEVLTLFAFSDENWQRPATEISALMQLLEEYIAREVAELKGQGVAVHVLGDRTRLAPGARGAVERIERETHDGARLALNLCISYSSRGELAQAARLLAEEVLKGVKRLEDIDEDRNPVGAYRGAGPGQRGGGGRAWGGGVGAGRAAGGARRARHRGGIRLRQETGRRAARVGRIRRRRSLPARDVLGQRHRRLGAGAVQRRGVAAGGAGGGRRPRTGAPSPHRARGDDVRTAVRLGAPRVPGRDPARTPRRRPPARLGRPRRHAA